VYSPYIGFDKLMPRVICDTIDEKPTSIAHGLKDGRVNKTSTPKSPNRRQQYQNSRILLFPHQEKKLKETIFRSAVMAISVEINLGKDLNLPPSATRN